MTPQSPQPDQEEPVAPFRAGAHADCLWIEPVYHQRGYEEAPVEVWLRVAVAQRLTQAAAWLLGHEVGLLVWDGWRPASLQQRLWGEYRDQLAATSGLEGKELDARVREFVAPVEEGQAPPAHSTGGAVDVTLCSLKGRALDMGGVFDELTDRSHPDFYERDGLLPDEVVYRDRRRLLDQAMREVGFRRLPSEWWHFEYGTPNWSQWTGERALFGPLAPAS